jgi:hypothetical protein
MILLMRTIEAQNENDERESAGKGGREKDETASFARLPLPGTTPILALPTTPRLGTPRTPRLPLARENGRI